jgi:hypothetical protein
MRVFSRIAPLTVVAALAIGAVGTATASAKSCTPTKAEGGVRLCINGQAAEKSYAFTGKGSSATFKSLLGTVECTAHTSEGSLSQEPSAGGTNIFVKLTGCTVKGRPECVVSSFQTTRLAAAFPSAAESTLSNGSTFAILDIPECSGIEGDWNISGTQRCLLPGSSVEAETHELSCEASGSSLKLAGNPATLTLKEQIKLSTGQKFSLKEA